MHARNWSSAKPVTTRKKVFTIVDKIPSRMMVGSPRWTIFSSYELYLLDLSRKGSQTLTPPFKNRHFWKGLLIRGCLKVYENLAAIAFLLLLFSLFLRFARSPMGASIDLLVAALNFMELVCAFLIKMNIIYRNRTYEIVFIDFTLAIYY